MHARVVLVSMPQLAHDCCEHAWYQESTCNILAKACSDINDSCQQMSMLIKMAMSSTIITAGQKADDPEQ